MRELPVEPPEEFTELVRDALLHLYDLAHLQTHPLLAVAGAAEPGPVIDCRLLRQALLDAIRSLHPGPGVAATSRAWRCYRILELRYVVGLEVEEAIERIALGKRQYHREHHRALQAISSLLWQRWRLVGGWDALRSGKLSPRTAERDQARDEAERLALGESASFIDPSEVLQGVGALLQPLCARRGVELRLELPERLPTIRGDRVALRQALLSILTHIIGAVDPGTLTVAATRDVQHVNISITGSGAAAMASWQPGIAESHPFIAILDGSLVCQSSPNQLGQFALRLCIPTSDHPTLLVVDNNEDFISLVKRYLTGHNWEVIGAPDVDHAFALARQRRPRAILLDVIIPGRDGWDLLMELKTTSTTRDIPVLVCSVLHESEMATSLGAAAYLQKPVEQRQLLAVLRPYQ